MPLVGEKGRNVNSQEESGAEKTLREIKEDPGRMSILMPAGCSWLSARKPKGQGL